MEPVIWLGESLKILDQTKLPSQESYIETSDYKEVAGAIRELKVRGAPAIGVAAAYGVALGALHIKVESNSKFIPRLKEIISEMGGTRPTAKNMFKALERIKLVIGRCTDVPQIKQALVEEAIKIHKEEREATKKVSTYGAELLKDGDVVLTHCNAGPIATAGEGTALGVIIKAHNEGKEVSVIACETRPLLQGARLTAWELKKAGVPFRLITDSMAGYMMQQGKVSCVITGADRIALNGDTANKIGTYSHAVLAKVHNIPFYIAAPFTTIDESIKTGTEIPIEERSAEEVTQFRSEVIAPEGTLVYNPAFDVTPNEYITAIITEKGVVRAPFSERLWF